MIIFWQVVTRCWRPSCSFAVSCRESDKRIQSGLFVRGTEDLLVFLLGNRYIFFECYERRRLKLRSFLSESGREFHASRRFTRIFAEDDKSLMLLRDAGIALLKYLLSKKSANSCIQAIESMAIDSAASPGLHFVRRTPIIAKFDLVRTIEIHSWIL